MPVMLATTASEGINILTSTPSILADLHTNIFAIRAVLEKSEYITLASHPASALIHVQIRTSSSTSNSLLSPESAVKKRPSNPTSLAPRDPAPSAYDYETEDRLLQEVVEECLAQGVLVTRARRLHAHELLAPRPSIKVAVSAALTRKECEKAATVLKGALAKVLGRR